MTILWVDFETRSACDLLKAGAYNYAKHPSTQVLCMSYAFNDDPIKTWRPGMKFPSRVAKYTGQIRAHNAAFERLIFWHVLRIWFELPQFYCTAAQARANCFPGSLEDVGRFISSNMRKDYRGKQLIRTLSVPRPDGSFCEDETLMGEMIQYCEQDVRVMREVSKAMRQLSDTELADYHINEEINDRGVRIDKELCENAARYAAEEQAEIEQIVQEVSNGAITSARSPAMRSWVYERVGLVGKGLMTVYKDDEAKISIDKTVRANLLVLAEENSGEVPPHVADVIQCADDIWASSVAKFSRLLNLADAGDRVRGAFVFAGGSATGRAASYGAQVHNFTRKTAKEPDAICHAMVRNHKLVPKFGPRVTDVLKGMLRPALVPAKGNVFVVADWSSIEARMNPWLSNEPSAEEKLELFRQNQDVYKHNAAKTWLIPVEEVSDDQRQIGKVQELSCGYGGGLGAFQSMGRVYGVKLNDEASRQMVNAWRDSNPWAVKYWDKLESAYRRAMRNPNQVFSAGRVHYLFQDGQLWYTLPSGRVLCYPWARIEQDQVTYAKASWKPTADATEWPRARLWKGLACENITQAAANDVLRLALRNVRDVVLHVHDEIVLEVPEEEADIAVKRLLAAMRAVPWWAEGLPLDATVKVMARYGK